MRQSAGEALVAVASLIKPEDHEAKLLKIVKALAEDLNEEGEINYTRCSTLSTLFLLITKSSLMRRIPG